jgi:hypothetical protein
MQSPVDSPSATAREIRLPANFLDTLVQVAGAPALEASGLQTGSWLAAALRDALGSDDLASVPGSVFWSTLDEVVRSRGWGTLRQERVHSGVAVVVAEGWAEGRNAPGCPFTVGLLSALFSEVAGSLVAVTETACSASSGGGSGGPCRFAFGSEVAIDAIRSAMDEGHDEEAALASL